MSIEIFYYPKTASREHLHEHLLQHGFKKSKDLFRKWPEGSLNFYWFDETDYKSITGVDATIFPLLMNLGSSMEIAIGQYIHVHTCPQVRLIKNKK